MVKKQMKYVKVSGGKHHPQKSENVYINVYSNHMKICGDPIWRRRDKISLKFIKPLIN
jgi:hypothetical protein